jgi:N-ethylmaleimide reductase
MSTNKLFSKYRLGSLDLANRIVMAPMTRARAIQNLPNSLMATYYEQRARAGLIITEGVSPSPNGLGYARIPGVFSPEQIAGWKLVSTAVHGKDGRIFMQIMHTGRISHPLNLPFGARVLAPSAIKAAGVMWTDQSGLQDLPVPTEMSEDDLEQAKNEYVQAAKNAIRAGFDGIELHGANGYLLEQFLSPHSNQRKDDYGGNITNRARFVVEVAEAVSQAIGKEKTGIRLSPYGIFNDMPHYPEIESTYLYLIDRFNDFGLAYVHLLDQVNRSIAPAPHSIKELISKKFRKSLILCGGFSKEKAESELQYDGGDLIAFGRPFINNPDLVERLRKDWPLSEKLDTSRFYAGGEEGYVDYPNYIPERAHA